MPSAFAFTWFLVTSLALVLVAFAPAWGVEEAPEPHNTCQTAQVFGNVSLPFTVEGNLGTPSVDFFRFSATPGGTVIVNYEGAATGQGTLEDPFLGILDSACTVLHVNDDSGGTLNSRVGFVVPADGVFVVAATTCCDSDFTGANPVGGSYRLMVSAGGSIKGSIADSLGDGFFAFVRAFTTGGDFVGDAPADCCTDNKATYELIVPAGSHRLVVENNVGRVWYNNQPTFLQATNVVVNANQQVTGIDFTLPRAVRVTPRLNKDAFVPGETLVVDLELQNASPNAASVQVIVTAFTPGEPGINTNTFCCFQNTIGVFQQANIPIAALTDTTAPGVLTHHFTGSEPGGAYDVCVRVNQGRLSTQSCAFFIFTP